MTSRQQAFVHSNVFHHFLGVRPKATEVGTAQPCLWGAHVLRRDLAGPGSLLWEVAGHRSKDWGSFKKFPFSLNEKKVYLPGE